MTLHSEGLAGLRVPQAGAAGRSRVHWTHHAPLVWEALALAAVVTLLWPLFDRVAEFGAGRDARFAAGGAKNEAMQALVASAGAQWVGAMALGYACLLASRHAVSALAGAGMSLLAWALAGWAVRAPWPFAAARDFAPLRVDAAWWSAPTAPALALAVLGVMLLVAAAVRPQGRAARVPPVRTMSTRIGMAGLALATGVGWLVLLDLSAHAHAANRYLALYHQGHLWFAMTVFSVLLFLRDPLGRSTGWLLSVGGDLVSRTVSLVGRAGAWTLVVGTALTLLVVFGGALAHQRQLTSELGRIWLIVGGAWFFFLRGGPLAQRLARGRSALGSLGSYLAPLAFVVGVLVAAMVVTRDMGPLLISGYAAGGFVAATGAAWWHHRSGRVLLPALAAVTLFAGWIGAVTGLLLQLGTVDPVAAARLESLATPFSSGNDQLALVTWFQRAAPAGGWGLGGVPWCGYVPTAGCSGIPAQVHSDYTFSALVGIFGAPLAWAGSLALALWLHRLVRHHGRATRGEPRLVADGARLANDNQALLSWVAVSWVVLTLCQLAVTVAGNQAVLPLTGVTFPLVSYGLTSLTVNLAFLALCLNVTVAREAGRDA
jgi:cell division protein FtsW (lipid II flippase)